MGSLQIVGLFFVCPYTFFYFSVKAQFLIKKNI